MVESSITIRLATISEAHIVSEIVAFAYKDCQEKFKPVPEKIPTWFEWWVSLSQPLPNEHQKFIESNLTYLILINDSMIGTFRFENYDEKSELDDLCILPQYQNLGYGMYTLNFIEKICGTKCIELSTPYFCTANLYLYKKAGYRQVATLSDDTVIVFQKNVG